MAGQFEDDGLIQATHRDSSAPADWLEVTPRTLRRRYPAFIFVRGLVHAVAAEGMKDRFANVRAYAAGPPPMVDAALRWLLREARLKPDDIRYDRFS